MRSKLLLGTACGAVMTASVAWAAPGVDTSALRGAVNLDGLMQHMQALQDIADKNHDNRASGTSGYDASVEYVIERLRAANYEVTKQEFPFLFFRENAPATLSVGGAGVDTEGFEYTPPGNVSATVAAVDLAIDPSNPPNTSTSGCEASDFAGFRSGSIALIQRGTCTFFDKVSNAANAGAVGVIIFNEGQPGRDGLVSGTLGQPTPIPAVGVSFADGQAIEAKLASGVSATIVTDTVSEERSTYNVIAETKGGRDDRVVVVGAHLDSVAEGPGINDNGSGAATVIEIARQMSSLGIQPVNKVRFAFFGAEEAGLLGAEYYVSQLGERDRKNIAVNLNFDMTGSPNYVRFVYDGDGSDTATAGPNGSANVERVFLDYFKSQGLPTVPTAFDGRSDYGPFIAEGIPAGGLFSGAEGIKTEAEAETFGGTPGVAYDACYHSACDDIGNLSESALEELGDAAAHAVLTFAMTKSSVNGTAKASKVKNLPFNGPHARR